MTSLSHRLPASAALAFALVLACGGEQKPSAADAKTPEKTAAAKPPATPDKPAPDNKVKVVEGGDPSDGNYTLKVEPPPEGKIGREDTVMVRVLPNKPWHMNLDFPTSLKVSASDGVAVSKPDLAKADALKLSEETVEYAVKFTPSSAGDKEFKGTFKFAVCQDEACKPVTEELAFRVAVK